jgi:hypothetical protein
MLKYLRIAVTALSLTACVLLIALWVRSNWWQDTAYVSEPNTWIMHVHSYKGAIHLSRHPYSGANSGWHFRTDAIPKRDLLAPTPWPLSQWESWPFLRFHAAAPHWLLAAICGAVAAAPWIRWSKRFSLRTLLIAMTLVAVVLGVVAFKLTRPIEQAPIDVVDLGNPFGVTQ